MINQYGDVFNDEATLRPLKTTPLKIHLKEDAKPYAVTGVRPIPIAYRAAAHAEIEYMVSRGIIKKIEAGEQPSEWICPSFFLTKSNGKLRFVIDLRALNRNVVRSAHPFPPASEVFTTIPHGMKFFAVFDAMKGYWQLPIDENDQKYLHFMTPFGVYRFLRAPMGLVHSGDEYCLRGDQILHGVENVLKIVDDIAIFARTKKEFKMRIRELFERCKAHNFTLNREKIQIGREVTFTGYVIGEEGVKADPEKLAALTRFPQPKTVTDVRSFVGLVKQLGAFCPDLSTALEPLRELQQTKKEKAEEEKQKKSQSGEMKPSTLPSTSTSDEIAKGKPVQKSKSSKKSGPIEWTEKHQKAFEQVIHILTKEGSPALGYFDPRAKTIVITDASRKGYGAVLLQVDRNNEERLRLIQCFSKVVSDAETRYAVCELEATGIQYAIESFRLWLEGITFEIWTDHAPLVNIYNGQNLDAQKNQRLQRIVSKTAHLTFEVRYIQGTLNKIADALSRQPVFAASEKGDILLEDGVFNRTEATIASLEFEATSTIELIDYAKSDQDYAKIKSLLARGANKDEIGPRHPAKRLKPIWSFLSIQDDLIYYHNRIVVPPAARKQIVELLHKPHLGSRKTNELARALYYWPGMNSDIDHRIFNCDECAQLRPSKPMESIRTTTADYPWQHTSSDLATYNGKKFLIYADRYSGWPLVEELKSTTAEKVIKTFETWMSQYGLCESMRTDGGPPYNSAEFADFCKRNGIEHETSSAGYPRSNGHGEVNVKIIKRLLEKSKTETELLQGLREFRNTPRIDGMSPAQWLFGRRQKTLLPAPPQSYYRITDDEYDKHERLRVLGAERRTKTEKKRDAFEFVTGDIVRVQDQRTGRWNRIAKIIGLRNEGRSATVVFEGDETPRLRNRTKLSFIRHEDITEEEVQHKHN